MMEKHPLRLTVVAAAAALLLAACGGGSDAPPVFQGDRIEAYDTTTGKLAPAQPAAPAEAKRALPPGSTAARVVLGPLADTALPKSAAAGPGVRQQVGVARAVPVTAQAAETAAQLRWVDTGRGTRVAALAFTSQGAKGLRLGLRVQALPPEATVRFYAPEGAEVVELSAPELLKVLQENARAGVAQPAANTYWSPDFAGPDTTLEIEIPASVAPSAVQVAVPTVSHYVIDVRGAQAAHILAKVGESGRCNIDVSCRPEYAAESRSVARMVFVSGGKSYLCTGTLLNDTRNSGTPYFLSANHCITGQDEASSLLTDWFYRSTACNAGDVNPGAKRVTGGATLLYATASTDTAFMRLRNQPPQGVVYAGSYFGDLASVGTALVGVHHPSGDLQKFSLGQLMGYSICNSESCESAHAGSGRFLSVGWSQGTTESGSSGSALLQTLGGKRYVVGTLLGGSASCENPAGRDHYGRFDLPMRAALGQWLTP